MKGGRLLAALATGWLALPLVLTGEASAARQAGTVPVRTTLQVFAAASLAEAFSEIGHRLERERPGLTVRLNLAGSQQLAAQIEQGATADVFASADERWMAYARERGLMSGEPEIFARNRLVVIIPRTNPARIRRIQDLARGGIKLVLGADAVPVGRYARVVLRNLARDPAFGSDFATLALRNVVSEEENVKSVVGKVQLGEADAGLVYRSDVTGTVARYLQALEIPADANVVAAYPIAIVRDAREPALARAFVDLVLSREGQAILERRGFVPLMPAPSR
jgi:molybdate transport system substrate-binding protein